MAIPSFTNPLPIPSDLKAPHPQTPWRISPNLFNRFSQQPTQDSYKKQELTPQDPESHFISHYFHHQKPTNRSIAKVFCIHNASETTVFENKLPSLETEAQNSFFDPQWSTESLPQLRQRVMDRFQAITSPFTPFQVQFNQHRTQTFTHIRVLPLWHGSTAAKCDSICRSGFTFFGKHGFTGAGANAGSTDIGFFGSGIYFTTSARYATDIYSDGENLLLGWVSLRKPFPVISDTPDPRQCTDMKRLKGQGAYYKYNAHYIPVIPDPQNPNSANYYPCSVNHSPVWDELVVFQQSQTLVRFWVVLQVDLTHSVPGTHHTVGELLQIISNALDQSPVQAHATLTQLLETKETQLLTFPSVQPLSPPDLTLLNIINQLFDDQKKLRPRMVTKLLAPALPTYPLVPPANPQQNLTTPFSTLAVAPLSASLITPPPLPIVPTLAFGAVKWKEYIGDVGAEPPLPANIVRILEGPCPIFSGKKVKETHLLTLIPQTVNGKPLTLQLLGELVKKPLKGPATQFRKLDLSDHQDPLAPASHWVLMSRDVIEGSRSKSYSEQQNLVAQLAQKSGQPYQIPNLLDAAVSIFMEYIQSGQTLYSDNPWTWTRCQEKCTDQSQLTVGGYCSAGLHVRYVGSSDRDSYDFIGVSCSRKF